MGLRSATPRKRHRAGGMAARVPRAGANGRIYLPRGIRPEANSVIWDGAGSSYALGYRGGAQEGERRGGAGPIRGAPMGCLASAHHLEPVGARRLAGCYERTRRRRFGSDLSAEVRLQTAGCAVNLGRPTMTVRRLQRRRPREFDSYPDSYRHDTLRYPADVARGQITT